MNYLETLVVELASTHEAAYFEHCRVYAFGYGRVGVRQ
jgi:hypothetical protein